MPPKPKEFDMATLIGISSEADNGMKPSPNTGSGLVKLRVNGAIPCYNKHHRNHFIILSIQGLALRLSTKATVLCAKMLPYKLMQVGKINK